MSADAIITLVVVGIALFLFVTEYYTVDVVALGIMCALVLTGVISPREGVSGFANSATVTVASLFVVSDAVIQSGLTRKLSPLFSWLLGLGYTRAIPGMSALIGGMSGFINNTPIVATFIPVASSAAKRNNYAPARYLIPLSYVAIFGGTCTLIGTSTNLLVSGIASDAGEAGFSMFLFLPMGLVFVCVGTLYLCLFGRKLVPERASDQDFAESGRIHDFEVEVRVNDLPEQAGCAIEDVFKRENREGAIKVLQVRREDKIWKHPDANFELKEGDLLHLRGDMERIQTLIEKDWLTATKRGEEAHFDAEKTKLVQLVLLPQSTLRDRKLGETRFLDRYRAEVLAVRSRGRERFSKLEDLVLHAGDILLVQTDEAGLKQLREAESRPEAPFLSLEHRDLGNFKPSRMWFVAALLVALVTAAAAGLVPIMIAALSAVVILNLTRITTMQKAYQAIDWKVIFLIAGALSMGKAIESSGIADMLSGFLVGGIGADLGAVAVISALYLSTFILTEVMSNNAAAAIMAPIAISAAQAMEVSSTPLLLAVAFAGSASLSTPVGYQTNTMVYSAGNYRFTDFTRVGLPLNLIFWILASCLLPVFYPL
ncbi:MAG: SLC13 family permease [Opitutales bacterium]